MTESLYLRDVSESAVGFQRCTRCVMDNAGVDYGITFDADGVCNLCTDMLAKTAAHLYGGQYSDAKLADLVRELKEGSKRREYDCVVGISGGVDSSYLCYRLKELDLRVLAVHCDSGWNSELAVMNIERLIRLLDLEYQTYVIDWEEFRDLQLAFIRASIPNIEIPTDHALMGTLYRVASQHSVKYILTGSNAATEGIMPPGWAYNPHDLRHLKAIHRKFGTTPLRTFPQLGYPREMYYSYVRRIQRRRPLNYMDYKKEEAMRVLEDSLGWVYYGGKHYESVFTRFFQAYILPVKFGIDKRKAHLSTMICSNQMTRERALEELAAPLYTEERLREDKQFVLKKFQLDEDEFDEIMKAPAKTSRDYPNSERMLSLLYRAYDSVRRDHSNPNP